MDIRKRIIALVLMPVLGLFTSVSLADVSGPPNVSGNGIASAPGEIKNKNQCNGATFFKNVFPSLTNGMPGGSTTKNFTVDGKTVPMTVTWFEDNSFNFAIDGGYASRVGVTVDTNNFIYDYTSDPSKGMADTQLNFYGGATADDVNHLDLCLKTIDGDAPNVSIRVEPSSDGTTVFGTISIIATVTDESDVDVTIEIVNSAGDPVILANDVPTQSGDEYTWTWDTTTVPIGQYTITVNAVDTSILLNESSASLTVTVSLENCLEGPEGPGGSVLGCNPTGFMFNELPNDLANTNLLDGQTLDQVAVPAKLGAQDLTCGGPVVDQMTGEREFPFVARDPRWGELIPGEYNPRPLDLAEVFDLAQFIPAPVTGETVMRADTRGEPCLALLYGDASFNFAFFYDPQNFPNLEGSQRYTYALTQLPETVELGLSAALDAAGIEALGPNQIDLQKVPEATYQPTDRFVETFIGNQLGPFTFEVVNPIRVKTPDFSFYALGTVQICTSLLGSGLSPADGRVYYEAVLQCSTDLAVEYFDDLDVLLDYYGNPSLPNYPQACLLSPSAENLRVELNKARSMIKTGNWSKADRRLRSLLRDVKQATWLVDDRNCPGHAVMRVENLIWRNAQLDLAESLLP